MHPNSPMLHPSRPPMNPPPPYPEVSLLRSGVGFRIMKPLVILAVAPLLVPIGVYGLSKADYGFAAFFLVPSLLLLLVLARPLSRAGSFELTSHRLLHKPWLREWRAYPLASMTELKFDADEARVRCKSLGMDMAFVGQFDKLRGALAVWPYLARLPAPAASQEVFEPWTVWQASSTAKRSRRGFAIVMGDLAAFVPETFPPPSTAASAAGLAINLLTLPLGVAMVPVYVVPPIAHVLSFFFAAPPSVRRLVLGALVELMGGWAHGVAAIRCTPSPRPGGVLGVTLEAPNTEPIVGYLGVDIGSDLLRRFPNALAHAPTYR